MLSLLCLDCPAGSAGAGGFRGLVPCKSMCWRIGFNWTIQDSFGKQQLSKLQWWHLSKPDSMKMMCSTRGLPWTARGCCCCRCCVGCLRKFSPAFGRLEPLSIKVILSLMICTKSLHMYVPQIPNFMFWLFTFNALLSMFQKSPRYTNHQLNSQRHGHCPGRTQCVEA